MSEETKQYEQDACFYVWQGQSEFAWTDSTLPVARFSVVRAGEMRIHIRKTTDDEFSVVRYTDDLAEYGINTDAELRAFEDKGEDYFVWDNNPWFEVWSNKDGDQDLDEVFHELDDAIAYAEELWNKYGLNGDLWKDGE